MFSIFKKNRKKSTCYACGGVNKKVKLSTYEDDFTKLLLEVFETFKSERKMDQAHKRFKVLSTGEYGGTFKAYQNFLVKDCLEGSLHLLELSYSYQEGLLHLRQITCGDLKRQMHLISIGQLGDTPDFGALKGIASILDAIEVSGENLESTKGIPPESMNALGNSLLNTLRDWKGSMSLEIDLKHSKNRNSN